MKKKSEYEAVDETGGFITPEQLRIIQTHRLRYPGLVFIFRVENEYCVLPYDYDIVDLLGIPRSFQTIVLETHIQKLLRAGYRVAISEQSESEEERDARK